MVIKKLTYIGFALGIAVLSGCSDDVAIPDTLSGDGTKTPLTVTAVLDVNGDQAKTRAADKDFAAGDKLVAYLRHVTWNGGFTDATADARTSVAADKAPMLVTFTCSGSEDWNSSIEDILPFVKDTTCTITGIGAEANSKKDAKLTATPALYWDDFSANDPTKDGTAYSTNLRDPGHYLQSFYGYCYNGGEANVTTALTEATGVLGWKVATNQTSGFKTSDLLWSAEQTPVSYLHNATHDADHNGLILPFTHAMSMVTINITAGEGFADDFKFTGTEVQLVDVRTSCKATAPTVSLDYEGCTKDNVTMKPGTENGTRAFQCVIVPSILTVGNTLATITNMDGNLYTIQVTSNIIKGWKTKLKDTDEEVNNGTAQARPQHAEVIPGGKGHQMMSGVNYVLNVTLHKTEATVEATILDWNTVTAEGEGIIHFTNDIDKKGEIADALKANGFDVYKSTDADNFGTKATTMRWNKGTGKWRYNPVIYWQGNAVDEYFRALANVNYDDPDSQVNESLLTENGRDPLWGTTKAHSGTDADGQAYNYGEGDALHPRTGDVPLIFYHAMAKITFNLRDINRESTDESAKLDLSQATIQLTNLATGGTINLKDGSVSTSDKANKTFSEDEGATPKRMGYYAANENNVETHYDATKTIKEYTITPQDIENDAMLIITLANGTTYQAKLNTCTTPNGSTTKPVDKWEKGNHYIYDITLTKDQITFCAQIRDWVEIEASGTIMPEW